MLLLFKLVLKGATNTITHFLLIKSENFNIEYRITISAFVFSCLNFLNNGAIASRKLVGLTASSLNFFMQNSVAFLSYPVVIF